MSKPLNTDLLAYYAKMATDKDELNYLSLNFTDAQMENDLRQLHEKVSELVSGQRVLELACGAGGWTQLLAQSAKSVVATDINSDLIAIAQKKMHAQSNVQFEVQDAFDLQLASSEPVTACFGAFFWSHVKRQDQAALLTALGKRLGKDVMLIMLDRIYEDGITAPIARTDTQGNTYEINTVGDERFEVVRNYPTDSALRKKIGHCVRDLRIARFEHFWIMTCRLK